MKPERTETKNAVLDEALLDRARAGDPAALTALYEATSLAIYRSIHALLRDEDLVLDVQQDTYLKAFERLDQLREAASFLPWLRRIAVNEARMQLRRKQPLLFSQLSEDGAEEPELPDLRPEASPELALDREETNRLIREILDGLSDAQRMILGMYYYEQIPIKEIAENLNLSPGTVKTQLRRSRKRVETEVRRLEAQGIKLYGLGPLPFLLALLKRAKPAAGAGEKVLAGALPQAAEAAAESVAVHVGRSFFQTALGRVCLGLLAAAAIGGGALGYDWLKERALIGDVQPPDDPIRIESTLEPVETDEDLVPVSSEDPTTPTEATTEPESPEELTEPPTEATEPPTEPEPSEPAEVPKEPEPSKPAAVPTVPEPSRPEIQPTAPVSPAPTEPTAADSAVLGLQWEGESGSAADWTAELPEGAGSNNRVLLIAVRGDDTPEISTDNPNLLRVWYQGDRYRRDGDVVYYGWTISPQRSGTAHVLCTLNGKTTHSLAITVPDYPDRILSYSVEVKSNDIGEMSGPLEDCRVGDKYYFKALVQGQTDCSFSTNNPQVVTFGFPGSLPHAEAGLWCPRSDYYVWGQIIGAGDAEVYLNFKGEIVKTWIVHASEHIQAPDESDEELHMNP